MTDPTQTAIPPDPQIFDCVSFHDPRRGNTRTGLIIGRKGKRYRLLMTAPPAVRWIAANLIGQPIFYKGKPYPPDRFIRHTEERLRLNRSAGCKANPTHAAALREVKALLRGGGSADE